MWIARSLFANAQRAHVVLRGLDRVLLRELVPVVRPLLLVLLPLLPLTLCAAFERNLINMFVFATLVYYPLFFAITGQLQGLAFKQSFERAKRRYAGLFGVSTAFWLPVQLLQFLCYKKG